MGQKAGTAGITHHRHHQVLAADWPWMTAPWVVLATTAVALPFLRRGRTYRPRIWFPWAWSVGNLAMFCLWSVAKPNYYLPCMPGLALLIGIEWVRLTQAARDPQSRAMVARRLLQVHWVGLFVAAAVAPVVARQVAPQHLPWIALLAVVTIAAVVASAWAWRRGADAGAMVPLVAAWSAAILIVYGALAPPLNATRSHRALAAKLESLLPRGARTVMFFQELDEGLWFYLRDRNLVPVPGSQPQYNKGFDLYEEFQSGRVELDPAKRLDAEKQIFLKWLSRIDRPSSYVLIRKELYNPFASSLAGMVTPLHFEQNLVRHELVLLRVDASSAVANRPAGETRPQ
jgi:hypothetical protein